MPTNYTNWDIPHHVWSVDTHTHKYKNISEMCTIIITNDTQPGGWAEMPCSHKHSVLCEKQLGINKLQQIQ